jgi:hypothetical protein
MRVIVKIATGPGAGRKILLGPRQTVKIGRTEWADYPFPADGQMSGVHCSIETDDAGCFLKDLQSANGTFVNGRRIAAATELHDGDQILAGQTQFTVQIDSPQAAELRPAPAAVAAPAVEKPALCAAPAPSPLSAAPQLHYSLEKCESGLTLCRGAVGEIPPAELAIQFCQIYPVYLIVDFRNLGAAPPAELPDPQYLFDWFPADVAARVSPVIVAQQDLLGWPSLIEEGWGKDAMVCLFSKQEKTALVEHLRRSVRGKTRPDGSPESMIGYCWPSVLAPLLLHFTREFVGQLLSGIEAVLVELPDLPDTWQVFGGGQVASLLQQSGFVEEERKG